MEFMIGQNVCHPSYGPGKIVKIDEQTIQSKPQKYYVIRIFGQNLTSRIPLNATDKVGLRSIISEKQTEKVFSTLEQKPLPLPTDHKKRQSQLKKLIFSGRPIQIAQAIRELTWLNVDKGHLNAADRQLLEQGKKMLVAEVAIASQSDQNAVLALINDALTSALEQKQ